MLGRKYMSIQMYATSTRSPLFRGNYRRSPCQKQKYIYGPDITARHGAHADNNFANGGASTTRRQELTYSRVLGTGYAGKPQVLPAEGQTASNICTCVPQYVVAVILLNDTAYSTHSSMCNDAHTSSKSSATPFNTPMVL